MVNVTLSRGGTSVDIELLESGGTPLISKDVGKPNQQIWDVGSINPQFRDVWSTNNQYTIVGRLTGSSAYSDAHTLADLIKSNANGTLLDLSIPLNDFDDTIKVAPAAGQDESVALAFNPGWKDYVEVDLALTRVDELLGSYQQDASTPTTSGSGPIQITDGSTTVDLVQDVTIQRGVGRPNATVRRRQRDYPAFTDTKKTAYDGFELAFEFTDNAVSNINDLTSIFDQQLGTSPLTLDFQGVFGLGSFSVVPEGAQAMRHTRPAGEQATTLVPTVNLRRVA